jgi:hypothetical protein
MEKTDLFNAYYGEDPDYYSDKMTEYEDGHKFSFNFWAGFFGCFWFFYRKMYVAGTIVMFFTAIETILSYYYILSIDPPVSSLYFHFFQVINFFIFLLIISFLANTVYIKKSILVVKKVLLEHKPEEPDSKDLALLSMKGGVSVAASIIPLAILFVFAIGVSAYLFAYHIYI